VSTPPEPPPYAPALADLPPTADDLAQYLSMTQAALTAEVRAALDAAAQDQTDYVLGICDYSLIIADGGDPPTTVPSPLFRAVLMGSARLYRRRNSVNGYDGVDDLGSVPVRASDGDIERLYDRWRAWAFA